MPEKIHKVLADLGLGSRRTMETWIEAGRVTVNGQPAHIGQRVDLEDHVCVDGKLLQRHKLSTAPNRVLLYNKPEGVMCTRSDPQGRPTMFESLPLIKAGRWISVGRLDLNTSGLLLITNDGQLANFMMHPSQQIEREYLVRVFGALDQAMLKRLIDGVTLEDGIGRFNQVMQQGPDANNRWFRVTVTEGRNQFVRRMWQSQGLQVTRLKRIRYGPLILPRALAGGQTIELPPEDIDVLSQKIGFVSE